MPYVVKHPYQYKDKPVFGEGDNAGQCAQLAQKAFAQQHKHKKDMPRTKDWTAGKRVVDCKPGELTPGTVIATFDTNGRYRNIEGFHTALYASHTLDENGRPNLLTVIHQFQGLDRIKRETFHFGPSNSPRPYKDARNYYVVELEKPKKTVQR